MSVTSETVTNSLEEDVDLGPQSITKLEVSFFNNNKYFALRLF